ncbi:MAG: hypothetical protein ACK5PF_09360 [bacterium]
MALSFAGASEFSYFGTGSVFGASNLANFVVFLSPSASRRGLASGLALLSCDELAAIAAFALGVERRGKQSGANLRHWITG